MVANNIVRSETNTCSFMANIGDNNYSITITDGQITQVSNWATRGFYDKGNDSPDFCKCCKDAIRFIVNCNPKDLRNIYHALSEGEMKTFCKELQAEKIAELQF